MKHYIGYFIFVFSLTLNAQAQYHFLPTTTTSSTKVPMHNYIPMYPDASLNKNSYKEYFAFPFKIGDTLQVKSGKYWHMELVSSSSSIYDDYLNAVNEVNGNIFYKQRHSAGFSFNVKQPNGVMTWVKFHIKDNIIVLDIIDEKVMKQVLNFDINVMKMQLDALGKLTLGGIYFQSAKAILDEKSVPALEAAYKLLDEHKKLTLEIAGHTDNQGDEEYNYELSLKRAKSVQNWLVTKGIDQVRLRAVGHGEKYPVLSNDTPQQREENRRVELIDTSKNKKTISLVEIIQAYPHAKLLHEEIKEKSSTFFNVTVDDTSKRVEVVGSQRKRIYEIQTEDAKKDKQVSGLQIVNNYLSAIEKVGGKILYQNQKELTFKFSHANNKSSWGYLWAPNARYTLILVTQ